jgi:putative ABC transport system permease protein
VPFLIVYSYGDRLQHDSSREPGRNPSFRCETFYHGSTFVTLTSFVTKSAFRNKRRSVLTVISIALSLLVLTVMMSIWRGFYLDKGSAESAQRLITRHRVSLTQSLPIAHRQRIRSVPGVVAVAPTQWFGGIYKDPKPENWFAQFGTDPEEIFKVMTDFKIPPDQLTAWQRDQAGVVVDSELCKKYGWKLGDRIVLQGTIFPVNLELTIRGIFTAPQPSTSVYFNQKYVEEGVAFAKGNTGTFNILADSPEDVPKVAAAVDDMFRNSPYPTKTESEKAFQLSFVAQLGNVKAFILSICLAVVFATLLVSANTIAMSIRERTREVAVLKTLGFTRRTVLGIFVGESVIISLIGGIIGSLMALLIIAAFSKAPGIGLFFTGMQVGFPTLAVAWTVAAIVGFFSAAIPSYNAAKVDIVEGLRYIG